MGGCFHGPLVYSVNQYVKISEERAKYIFLFKKEEEKMKNSWKKQIGISPKIIKELK